MFYRRARWPNRRPMYQADPGIWPPIRSGFWTGGRHGGCPLRMRCRVWLNPHFPFFNPATVLVSSRRRSFSCLPGSSDNLIPSGRRASLGTPIGPCGRFPLHGLSYANQPADHFILCCYFRRLGVGNRGRNLPRGRNDGSRRFYRVGGLVVDFELRGRRFPGSIRPPGFALDQLHLRHHHLGVRGGGPHFFKVTPRRCRRS